MSTKRAVAKALNRVEHGLDRVRFFFMSQFGVRKPLTVRTYIGYGNGRQLFVRGRVLLQQSIRKPKANDSPWRNFINTYHRFESDEIPYATVRVSHGDATQVVQCDEEGFFYTTLEPSPLAEDTHTAYWQSVEVEVLKTPIVGLETADTTTNLPVIVPATGAQFGVISDLDDTIVQTDVLNLFKMLHNTIFRNAHTRLPFDGVPTFYQALQNGTGGTPNPIFYVSSSPWNLYDLIIDFYNLQEIPLGPVFLRDIGLSAHAVGGEDHMGHKMGYISKLMERHANLPFILIGDSGQKDPWVYQEAVRRYPGRIPTIYIRDVNGTDERRAEIALVQQAVTEMGSEMLLVETTCEAAAHAFKQGYIEETARKQVCRECQQSAPVMA